MNSPQTISQQASAPEQNVVIEASAGTGKTYLLITRLARLLLEGAEPDQILAITFTRKAAAEMQQRLTQRLYNWLSSDEATLEQSLQAIGVDGNAAVKQRARQLYEQSLRSVQQVKITTFHAFCQDILRRFPLEADIPPGFDLSESSGLLEQQAWDALWSEATLQPDGELATDLQTLLLHCQGLDSCRTALFEFLHHRSDWWALHESHNGDRARHAVISLQQQLGITAEEQPYRAFFSADTIAALNEYHDLLQQHSNTTNQGYGADIAAALNNHQADIQQAFNQATKPFLKQDLQPRAMKASKARAKAMGEQGQQRFLQLHETLTQALLACIDLQRRQQTWALSSAWYRCGDRLVNHYQRLKTEQRLLDFTDLEWQTYRLLNHAEHSHWVQYKLDQRINHILVDEFQDTNPTQWRLLLPLFQELASTQPSPSRESLSHHSLASVFLVGDIKQSIYRFRRADPELFTTAQHWLQQHLAAHTYPLAVSWRSSPAIIDFVNRVFSQPDFARYLPDFPRHDTHQTQLAGRVEFMPPIQHVEAEPTVIAPTSLRNPLLTPRLPLEQPLHYREGRQIAARIQQLVDGHYSFDGDKLTDYSDILILVKRRTHCHHYEQALREAGIPYQTSGKTTLFDSLEIQDMLALLETLMTPHNNLALATVLRSPLFACSNEELVLLSQHSRQADSLPWFDGLIMLAATAPAASALQRAAHWLPQWMQWVGVLPVHDLLDRIYSQANVIARFSAAFPAHLRQRVQANLTRFIELALEIDSGRYPSLPHFVAYLRSLHELAPDVLSEPHESQQQNCVQIMTIHAAKGLEAPIVFLADSGYQRPQSRAWQALINWPAASRQPDIFLLTGRKNELDNWSQQRIAEEEQQEQREDANLLYVALTRAKQGLYISACASGRQHGWYETLAQAYAPQYDMDHISQHGATVEQFGTLLTPIKAIPPATTTPPELEVSNELIHALRQPLFTPAQDKPIKPSATATDTDRGDSEYGDHHGRLRGQIIHRLLEHTIPPGNTTVGRLTLTDCLTQFQNEVVGQLDPHELEQWADEAQRLIEQPELQAIFDPQQYRSACNEMSLNYNSGQQSVHGIIDRLVITNDDVIIIDYKTHRDATAANIKTLAESYRQQMQYYANGVAQCWPGKRIRMMLIFTACGESVEL